MILIKILYYTGFYTIRKQQVVKWGDSGNIEGLKFALSNGYTLERIEAINQLSNFPSKRTIVVVQPYLKDPIEAVFKAAAKTLIKVGCNNKIKQEIEELENTWKIYHERKDNIPENEPSNLPKHYKWKKREWRKIVKEQLKKPMRR